MTRTLLLTIAAIGVGPAVLLAFGNLVCDFVSIVYRPISFSFRLYRPASPGESIDFLPALHLSTTTALLIVAGAALLLFGISRIQPETTPAQQPRRAPQSRNLGG